MSGRVLGTSPAKAPMQGPLQAVKASARPNKRMRRHAVEIMYARFQLVKRPDGPQYSLVHDLPARLQPSTSVISW